MGLAVWRKKVMPGKYMKHKKLTEVALVAAFASIVSVILPALWPCRDLYEGEMNEPGVTSWKYSTCQDGQVNEMSALTFNLQVRFTLPHS